MEKWQPGRVGGKPVSDAVTNPRGDEEATDLATGCLRPIADIARAPLTNQQTLDNGHRQLVSLRPKAPHLGHVVRRNVFRLPRLIRSEQLTVRS